MSNKGKTWKLSPESLKLRRERRKYIPSGFKGKKHSSESIEKIRKNRSGIKAWNYIEDRSLLKREDRRNDPLYKEWRKQVWLRDKFKCKIDNPDCKGKIEAHHILSWRNYPELRYQLNNGITLCHAHHPRGRSEEKRLIPKFTVLVSVSSEIN